MLPAGDQDEVEPQPGHQQAGSSMLYTTSCKTHSSAPEYGRNYRPKHVELIEIINKIIIIEPSWLFILLYQ